MSSDPTLALEHVPEHPAPRMPGRRGFAAISRERQREIAQLGGLAAQASGNAHRYTSETAVAAGKRGGCRDPERMRQLGRAGGLARGAKLKAKRAASQERNDSHEG